MALRTEWEFNFLLSDGIEVRNLTGTNNIKFEIVDQGPTSVLKRIKVRVHESSIVIAEIEAKKKVRMIMNFIKVSFVVHASIHLEGWNEIRNGVKRGAVGSQLIMRQSNLPEPVNFDLEGQNYALNFHKTEEIGELDIKVDRLENEVSNSTITIDEGSTNAAYGGDKPLY